MPKEKNSASSAILSAVERGARHFDHRADLVLDLHAGLLHALVGHGDGPLLEERQFLDGADERDHDLGQDALALLLHLDGRLDDRPHLHVADLGEDDRQPAAAEAHHRVELVQLLDPLA